MYQYNYDEDHDIYITEQTSHTWDKFGRIYDSSIILFLFEQIKNLKTVVDKILL